MKQIGRKIALAAVMVLIALCVGLVACVALLPAPVPVAAQTAGTYSIHRVADGSTAYTTVGGNLLGWEMSDYGAVIIHTITDASNTTSTLTITPQYSLVTGVPCSDVDDWFSGVDYVVYSSGPQYGIIEHVPISYTYNTTASLAFSGTESLIEYTTNYTDSLAWTSAGSTTITGSAPYVVSTTYAYYRPSTNLTGDIPYVLRSIYEYETPVVTTYTLSSAAAGFVGVNQSLSLTGDTYAGREFAVYGRCMRLSLAVSYGTITPTIYVMDRDVSQ